MIRNPSFDIVGPRYVKNPASITPTAGSTVKETATATSPESGNANRSVSVTSKVAKANRHASSYPSNTTCVSALSAEILIISVGKSSSGHPDATIISRWVAYGEDCAESHSDLAAQEVGDTDASPPVLVLSRRLDAQSWVRFWRL